jgi:hypothetical protein
LVRVTSAEQNTYSICILIWFCALTVDVDFSKDR